ncbi:MAG: TolC family protein [Candidatus Latescibacterota bacterium]|nr:TolC family protein [Candidatus Latescibacterota bacterium]
MRTTPLPCRLILVLGLLLQSAAAQTAQLEVLVAEALSRHPRLEALSALATAQRHAERPAAALPDPHLRFDLLNVPLGKWDTDSSPMSGRQLGLSQRLPWPGRREAERQLASTQTQIAEARTEDEAARLVEAVKQAYLELVFVDQALAITARNQDLIRDYVRMAQTKYAVGTGRQQDILKAQVFLSSLGDRLLSLHARRDVAEARLNALRSRAIGTPIASASMTPATHLDYGLADLTQMAIASRPALAELRWEREHWKAAEHLAKLAARPNFDFSVAYRQRSFEEDAVAGRDFLSAGVAVRLPLWRAEREHEQAAEAQQRQRAASAEVEALRLQIELGLQELLVKARLHRDQMELLRQAILPQAEQALTAAIAGYRVDHVDFGTLLDSQVAVQQYEIQMYHHHINYEKTLASLEALVGVRLF